jgi:hypothetical protein
MAAVIVDPQGKGGDSSIALLISFMFSNSLTAREERKKLDLTTFDYNYSLFCNHRQ